MTRKLYLALSLIMIILSSCKNSQKNENITHFTREDFKKHTKLTGENIEFDAGLTPFRYYLLKDTLIFVESFKSAPFCYDVYGLKSKKHILSFGKKGKGPFEYLSVDFKHNSNNSDYFSVKDLSAHNISIYHIDSLLLFKDRYIPKRFKIPEPVKDYCMISKDSILAYNDYYFKYRNIQNNVAIPLFKINLNHPLSNEDYINGSKYYTANASGGCVAHDSNIKQSYVAYHYEDKFEIYNKNLKLIKRLIGPDNIMPKYQQGSENLIGTENDKYHRAYYDIYLGKNAVFLLYVGYNGVSYEGIMKKNVEVFKIGFDGQLIHHYQLDRLLITCFIDRNEQYLYGSEIDASNAIGETKLVRFKLD